LGRLRAKGWLERQLRIQADGLSGHLDEFWPDVGQSQWFGGQAEGGERAPYWLDGVIPLAWCLPDPALQSKARRYVNHIVTHQRPNGWYAAYPADASAKSYDLWSILLANKALVQYHEATGEHPVLEAVLRNLKAFHLTLDRTPLFGWGRYRWFEGLVPVYYAFEKTGETWLLDLARKLYDQGFDYMKFYQGEDITVPTPRRGLWKWDKHVVNTAMALKAYALAWRFTRRETERAYPARMLAILDRYHGQVTGMFTVNLTGLRRIDATSGKPLWELIDERTRDLVWAGFRAAADWTSFRGDMLPPPGIPAVDWDGTSASPRYRDALLRNASGSRGTPRLTSENPRMKDLARITAPMVMGLVGTCVISISISCGLKRP
jgi:hypothetical protein